VELLEDQSDMISAKSSQFCLIEPINSHIVDQHLAAIDCVKTGDYVHERGFSRATLSHERGALARTHTPRQTPGYMNNIATVTK
tara:strand:- start:1266 stop:1517 length:252 start_codon:yes stop_codon:yes gene_type:complete